VLLAIRLSARKPICGASWRSMFVNRLLGSSNKKRNHYLRIAEHYCSLAEAEELNQHQDT